MSYRPNIPPLAPRRSARIATMPPSTSAKATAGTLTTDSIASSNSSAIDPTPDPTRNLGRPPQLPHVPVPPAMQLATQRSYAIAQSNFCLQLLPDTSYFDPKTKRFLLEHNQRIYDTRPLAAAKSSAPTKQEVNTPPLFPRFGKLPPEIQIEIWRQALPDPVTIAAKQLVLGDPNSFVFIRPVPSIFMVCKAARIEILKHYTLVEHISVVPAGHPRSGRPNSVYVDFKRDTVLMATINPRAVMGEFLTRCPLLHPQLANLRQFTVWVNILKMTTFWVNIHRLTKLETLNIMCLSLEDDYHEYFAMIKELQIREFTVREKKNQEDLGSLKKEVENGLERIKEIYPNFTIPSVRWSDKLELLD